MYMYICIYVIVCNYYHPVIQPTSVLSKRPGAQVDVGLLFKGNHNLNSVMLFGMPPRFQFDKKIEAHGLI